MAIRDGKDARVHGNAPCILVFNVTVIPWPLFQISGSVPKINLFKRIGKSGSAFYFLA